MSSRSVLDANPRVGSEGHTRAWVVGFCVSVAAFTACTKEMTSADAGAADATAASHADTTSVDAILDLRDSHDIEDASAVTDAEALESGIDAGFATDATPPVPDGGVPAQDALVADVTGNDATPNDAVATDAIAPDATTADAGGYRLWASTLLGGGAFDRAQGIFVAADGAIYLGGNTGSADFPVTNGAYDTTKNGPSGPGNNTQDGFVAKLSADGRTLLWATYLGGSARDQVYGVRLDAAGNVIAVGSTGSSDFPTTPGAYDRTNGGPIGGSNYGDVFVAKLSPNGATLLFSTFIGGSGTEHCRGDMFIDTDGTIVISGDTASADFPIVGPAFQSTFGGGGSDAYVARLSADGRSLVASTYLGGTGAEAALGGVFVLGDGTIVTAGGTSSPNFPTTQGSIQRSFGGPGGAAFYDGDAFVTRFQGSLASLVFSTYIGGSGRDNVVHNQGLVVDSSGRAIATGTTDSANFPTTSGALRRTLAGGPHDGFVVVLAANGSSLAASTYLGGNGSEEPSGITVDTQGVVYVGGNTSSTDWPTTTDAFQRSFQGGVSDAFMTVLADRLDALVYSTYLGGSGSSTLGERGRGVWLTPNGIATSGVTDSPNFPTTAGAYDRVYNGGEADAFVSIFRR